MILRLSAILFLIMAQVAHAQLPNIDIKSGNLSAGSALATGASAALSLSAVSAKTVTIYDFGSGASTCNGTQSTSDSTALTNALAAAPTVYIPPKNPTSGAATNCVIGNVVLNGSGQLVYGSDSVITPLNGANFVFQVSGFKNSLSGLYISGTGVGGQTTITGTAAANATAVTIGTVTGTPVAIGQRYSIRADTGYWATGYVTGVSGSTITLSEPLPAQASSGAKFWSTFGDIYVTNANYPKIENTTLNASWGGILMDDPTGGTTQPVQRGYLHNIILTTGNQFGIWKGRNVHDTTIDVVQAWGGYPSTDNYTGNGSTTTFALSEQVPFVRDLTVTVGGVTKALTTDYTIATSGLTVTFNSPPANAAAIVLSHYADGHDGYGEDGRTGTEGGMEIGHFTALQWQNCGNLIGAQLFNIHDSNFDTCGENSMLLSGTSQWGILNNDNFSFSALNGLNLTNSSVNVVMNGDLVSSAAASYPSTGVASTAIAVGAGSTPSGTVYNSSTGFYSIYNAGTVVQCTNGNASGGMFAGACSAGAQQPFTVSGSGSGSQTFNGTVMGYTGTFNYISATHANGFLTIQQTASTGEIDIQVGAGVVEALVPSKVTFSVPTLLMNYTVSTLPTCGAALKGGMAYVTDATTPTYNGALTGGSTVIVPVFCNGTAWTAH